MPYPPELLNSHEKIVVDNHPHWLYFLEPALAGLGTLLLLGDRGLPTSGDARSMLVTHPARSSSVGLALWALVRLINWRAVDFVVTTDRVIYRSGVFAKRGMEIPLPRVNNVNFSQGILERLLGAGNLMIESGGEEGSPTSPTSGSRSTSSGSSTTRSRPIATARRDDEDGRPRAAASPPPPPPPRTDVPVSVADEIAKLEELVQRGTITPAQFEAQKQRLLGG